MKPDKGFVGRVGWNLVVTIMGILLLVSFCWFIAFFFVPVETAPALELKVDTLELIDACHSYARDRSQGGLYVGDQSNSQKMAECLYRFGLLNEDVVVRVADENSNAK